MTFTQRDDWPGYSGNLGEGFRLHKGRCGRQHVAVCWLRTHRVCWELVLNVDGNLQRWEVCHSQDEVLDRTEGWRAELVERGWR